jgi:hypothetical protein
MDEMVSEFGPIGLPLEVLEEIQSLSERHGKIEWALNTHRHHFPPDQKIFFWAHFPRPPSNPPLLLKYLLNNQKHIGIVTHSSADSFTYLWSGEKD